MWNVIIFEGKLFHTFFSAVQTSLLFSILDFTVCNKAGCFFKPITNKDTVVSGLVSQTSETWEYTLFPAFTVLDPIYIFPLPAAVNNWFGVYLQRLVVSELALIINDAPFPQICRMLQDLASKFVLFSPCLAKKNTKQMGIKLHLDER